jgi:hypothetical protein
MSLIPRPPRPSVARVIAAAVAFSAFPVATAATRTEPEVISFPSQAECVSLMEELKGISFNNGSGRWVAQGTRMLTATTVTIRDLPAAAEGGTAISRVEHWTHRAVLLPENAGFSVVRSYSARERSCRDGAMIEVTEDGAVEPETVQTLPDLNAFVAPAPK